jgi:hypothetical protein
MGYVRGKAHIIGAVASSGMAYNLREDLSKVFSEDTSLEVKLIFLGIILMPMLMGGTLKYYHERSKKIMTMVTETYQNKDGDERTDFGYKCLRYLVLLLRQYREEENIREKIEAKAKLVQRMVKKVLNGEEDLIESKDYNGNLNITGHTVPKSAETDF